MSATSAPYGFVPLNHPTGEARAVPYTIASGYATDIYKYQPVKLVTAGSIQAAAAGDALLGVFAGCEYVDANGVPHVSNTWPASTTATKIVAYVWDDPLTRFSAQADGSVATTAIGDQADESNATANGNGMSQATLSATLKGAGVQGQFRIMAFEGSVDNVAGDSFTKVVVQIAKHQLLSPAVAI